MKKFYALLAACALAFTPVTVLGLEGSDSVTGNEGTQDAVVSNDDIHGMENDSVTESAIGASGVTYDAISYYDVAPTGTSDNGWFEVRITIPDLGTFVGLWHNDHGVAVRMDANSVYNVHVEGNAVVFRSNSFSPYAVAYVKKVDQPSQPAATAAATSTVASASSTSASASDSSYNPSLDKGATWYAADGSYMTSLGDGRYYNQFYTVFDGAGNIVGKYNPNTGAVGATTASAAVNTSVANGTYVVPNTADKN